MKIKGIEFEFYCAKCKGMIKESGSNKSTNVRYCICSNGPKKQNEFNGIRFNQE